MRASAKIRWAHRRDFRPKRLLPRRSHSPVNSGAMMMSIRRFRARSSLFVFGARGSEEAFPTAVMCESGKTSLASKHVRTAWRVVPIVTGWSPTSLAVGVALDRHVLFSKAPNGPLHFGQKRLAFRPDALLVPTCGPQQRAQLAPTCKGTLTSARRNRSCSSGPRRGTARVICRVREQAS